MAAFEREGGLQPQSDLRQNLDARGRTQALRSTTTVSAHQPPGAELDAAEPARHDADDVIEPLTLYGPEKGLARGTARLAVIAEAVVLADVVGPAVAIGALGSATAATTVAASERFSARAARAGKRLRSIRNAHAEMRGWLSPEGASENAPAVGTGARPSCEGSHRYRLSWARALAKVFDVDVTPCPRCEQKGLQPIAVIPDAQLLRALVAAIERTGEP